MRYRTQLAPHAGFSVIESDEVSTEPQARAAADLPDGIHRIRVRAIDAQGLEGHDGEREIVVAARPEPPFPSLPEPDAFVIDEQPQFRWSRSSDSTATYRFQLAGDETFRALLLDVAGLENPVLTFADPLPPGQYFWRVALRTQSEGQGPFSDAQRFRRPPPGPLPEPPQVAGDKLTLRWRAGGAEERYQIQISSDPNFARPDIDRESVVASLVVDRPPAGTYHIRVRTQQPGDPPGPWGKAQMIEIPQDYWRTLLLLLPFVLLTL